MKNKKLTFLLLSIKRLFKRLIIMKFKDKTKILYCANISLVVSIFVLLFVNLVQSNMAASEGFVMNDLETELNNLRTTNKEFSLKSAELQDLGRITKVAQEHGMVLADGVDYIVIKDYKDVAIK
ncbi:MAG: hypothetical protein PHZ07_02680 [Patescibacteria group bacterium]|nr:hypothetical protein [Patescibacteria group bacterium]MDD4304674.1 hypothetical protein [Patescibacteria group bacterium]MDD4695358.1 hypothetical protein [Patescibacteria group bacterium]